MSESGRRNRLDWQRSRDEKTYAVEPWHSSAFQSQTVRPWPRSILLMPLPPRSTHGDPGGEQLALSITGPPTNHALAEGMTLALFYVHSAVPEHSMLRFVTDRRRRETSTDWEDDEAGLRGIACYARSLTTLVRVRLPKVRSIGGRRTWAKISKKCREERAFTSRIFAVCKASMQPPSSLLRSFHASSIQKAQAKRRPL